MGGRVRVGFVCAHTFRGLLLDVGARQVAVHQRRLPTRQVTHDPLQSKIKKEEQKKTIQLQLIPVKSSVFKQNLPTSNNTHGAKPAER